MCMIDDADRCEVWRETVVKAARKAARCSECGRPIATGETYRRIFHVSEGDAGTDRQCQHCMVAADWLTKECNGYCTSGVQEDIREHADEYRSAGLWRLVVGQRRKWKRFDEEGLMPIPRLPPLSTPEARAS